SRTNGVLTSPSPSPSPSPGKAMAWPRSTPGSRASSFAHRTLHRLDTTDALLHANMAVVGFSSPSSPDSASPPPAEHGTTDTSVQPSPDALHILNGPQAPPPPLQLPDSMAPPAAKGAMADAVPNGARGTGLIRRISSRLSRRRRSTTQSNTRDRSSGPLMHSPAFNRSEEAVDVDDGLDDVAVALPAYSPGSGAPTPALAGVGPVVPSLLQRGTVLTKVTKKKRKTLKFVLDLAAAKVCWDPARPTKRFYVDDIRDVRLGADARNYREECQVPAEVEPRWFTVLYADQQRSKGRPIKAIHLIAPNDLVFHYWTNTLRALGRHRMNVMTGFAGLSEASLRALWERETSRHAAPASARGEPDGRLNFADVEQFCHRLHLLHAPDDLRRYFAHADRDGSGLLDFTGFKHFVKAIRDRKDLRLLFAAHAADPDAGLDQGEFLAFLARVQGVPVADDGGYWTQVFEKYAVKDGWWGRLPSADDEAEPTDRMKLEGFAAFMVSPSNAALHHASGAVALHRPLSEYFVSSSHNTYLLGRQVAGESSTEAYIWALERGCRCVEVDCWDGPDGRPVVNHGRTLTSSVLFADCIAVIGKYAFASSPYPLIVSLEVHCCPEQQVAMADILRAMLGARLVTEPFITNAFVLPSPEELKHRILIKVKAGDPVDDAVALHPLAGGRRHRSISSPTTRAALMDTSATWAARPALHPPPSTPPRRSPSLWDSAATRRHITAGTGGTGGTGVSLSSATEDSDSKDGGPGAERRTKTKASKIVKPLGDLAVYTRGQKYTHFARPESKTYNHVFSFSERTVENLCRDADLKAQLEQHNLRCLMRVYPAGYRITSSNFNPNKYWRRGVQMVALNWQTYDLAMQMNDAMFAAGADRTGYVLKPKELRRSRQSLDLELAASPAYVRKARKLVRFSIDVISGQQLPRSRNAGPEQHIHPYVELEVFCADDSAKGVATGQGGRDASARNGMSGIGSPHRRRTRIVPGNGYNPLFDDQFTIAVETKFPSLVFLRWTVGSSPDGRSYGDRNGALASFTAKLDSLQEGYRHLPLFDNKGEQFLFSTLFCRFTKQETLTVARGEVKASKVETWKLLGRSVFGRTSTPERKKSLEAS
ncbi:MAG: Phospholipase C, partial [Phylliscum demangeonii]